MKELTQKAYDAGMAIWKMFDKYEPIVGFYDLININLSDHHISYFYVEYQFAQALQKLITEHVIAWAIIIGHKHAAVLFNKGDDLLAILESIRKFNRTEATNNTQCLINRIICSSRPAMKKLLDTAGLTATDNVLYDRHKEKQSKGGGGGYYEEVPGSASMNLSSDCEVEMSLANINYYQDPNLLAAKLEKLIKGMLSDQFGLQGEIQIRPKSCMLMMLQASSSEIASCLCKKVCSLMIKQHNANAHVKFQSKHHQLYKDDFNTMFNKLMITDCPHHHGHQEESGIRGGTGYGGSSSSSANGGSSSSANGGASAAASAAMTMD